MDIGEAVAIAIIADDPSKCPFCESSAGPNFEEKVMENDATALAKNAGKMPHKKMTNPDAREDYEIFEDYWDSDSQSKIVMSPHHIIPGNASLAMCPQILKWMAGSVSVKKKEHSKSIKLEVKKINAKVSSTPDGQREAKRQKLFAAALPPKQLKGDPEGIVRFALDEDKVERHTEPVKDKYVTGKIKFDVNDMQNCAWLPSHCAIANWTEVKQVAAWHEEQDSDTEAPITFETAYAYNAMESARMQFHDAHPVYSTKVIELLKELDIELQKAADACLSHPNTTSKKDGPYRAPQTLTSALYKLADLLSDQLDIDKNYPEDPFYTSKLSLAVADLY